MPVDGQQQHRSSDTVRNRSETKTDRSSGEAGSPVDMDYYRKSKQVGARLTLGAWAPALVLLALIAMASLWFLVG